jgi:hypothetical protein
MSGTMEFFNPTESLVDRDLVGSMLVIVMLTTGRGGKLEESRFGDICTGPANLAKIVTTRRRCQQSAVRNFGSGL